MGACGMSRAVYFTFDIGPCDDSGREDHQCLTGVIQLGRRCPAQQEASEGANLRMTAIVWLNTITAAAAKTRARCPGDGQKTKAERPIVSRWWAWVTDGGSVETVQSVTEGKNKFEMERKVLRSDDNTEKGLWRVFKLILLYLKAY